MEGWSVVPAAITVAAFDFDGTLSKRDCVVPFLRRVAGTVRLCTGLLAPRHGVVPALVRRDRDALKAAASMVAFRGRDAGDVDVLGEAFAAHIEAHWLRRDTVAELAGHREAGHRVVIVSASLEPYLVPVAASLGADAALCTRLERGGDGRLTGHLVGANCRGAEKLRRLEAWLTGERLERANVHLVAYGDSAGDHELLAEADLAMWAAHRTLAEWRSP